MGEHPLPFYEVNFLPFSYLFLQDLAFIKRPFFPAPFSCIFSWIFSTSDFFRRCEMAPTAWDAPLLFGIGSRKPVCQKWMASSSCDLLDPCSRFCNITCVCNRLYSLSPPPQFYSLSLSVSHRFLSDFFQTPLSPTSF